MNGSTYYSNLMQDYIRKITSTTKEKNIYDKVIPMLESLLNGLPDIKTNLVNAEANCKNGGFISEGEPYGQGRFKDCYTKLANDISTLESVIASSKTRQSWLNDTINGYKSQLEIARSNYQNALNMEKSKEL